MLQKIQNLFHITHNFQLRSEETKSIETGSSFRYANGF